MNDEDRSEFQNAIEISPAAKRDVNGHYKGCFGSGCAATRCRTLVRVWRAAVGRGEIKPVEAWDRNPEPTGESES